MPRFGLRRSSLRTPDLLAGDPSPGSSIVSLAGGVVADSAGRNRRAETTP
jgi:hypothetical protein